MEPHHFRPAREDGSPDVGAAIRMIYTNYKAETDHRLISPVGLWFGSTDWHPNPCWLFHAYDWQKMDWRDFELFQCDFAGGAL